MGHRLRFIPPGGSLVEVTNRTIQGRFLLRPSVELNRLLIGVLGRAQRIYGVKLHACVVLSNHYHLLLTVDSAQQLAKFVGYFQGNLAKEAGRLHRWRGPFWHRRYQHIVVSDEAEAQIARLRYIMANSCKENLVSSPLDWPGVSSIRPLLDGGRLEGIWIDRTRQRVATPGAAHRGSSQFCESEHVEFVPIPCWRTLRPTLMRKRIRELISEIEADSLARHRARSSRPLGKGRILSQDPHAKPTRSKWSAAPFVHCVSQEARTLLREAYSGFVEAFQEAANRLNSADIFGEFPDGAFPPHLAYQQPARAPS